MTYVTLPQELSSWAWKDVPVGDGKAYYLQLIGTNTSADNPWVVPEGHSVIGREGSYLIVRIDAETDRWDQGRDDRYKEEEDGEQDHGRA
jgi:hypothetical protein